MSLKYRQTFSIEVQNLTAMIYSKGNKPEILVIKKMLNFAQSDILRLLFHKLNFEDVQNH